MEKLLNCPQCKSNYIDPRLLPCEHTLCLTCVEQIQNSRHTKDRVCPVDKTAFPVNLRPRDLPQNLLCTTLATLLPRTTPNTSGRPAVCVNCDDQTPALLWCEVCGDLCEACSTFLHSLKALKSHSVIILQAKKQATILPKCFIHEANKTDLYCLQCKTILCHICEKASHSTHKCIPALDAANSSKDVLKSNLVCFINRKDIIQKDIIKKREEVKTREAKKEVLLAEIEEIKKEVDNLDKEIEEKNKEIESNIQQFNQSETIYKSLVQGIDDQNSIDILDPAVFEGTKSLVGSLYKAFYNEEFVFKKDKTYATFNVESKTDYLILNNKNNNATTTISETTNTWANILGSATSAQSFVWKFKLNQINFCNIGLVPPSSFVDVRKSGHICYSGVIGFFHGCHEIPNSNKLHSNCPGWKVNDIVGLELDNGILRFYHNGVVVKEMEFNHLDYVPGVSICNSNVTLITE